MSRFNGYAQLRKLARRSGPGGPWRFRLYGWKPTARWLPVRITQLVGGRTWSISFIRNGEIQQDPRPAPRLRIPPAEDLYDLDELAARLGDDCEPREDEGTR